jgi:hypothetical protein
MREYKAGMTPGSWEVPVVSMFYTETFMNIEVNASLALHEIGKQTESAFPVDSFLPSSGMLS